MKKALFLSLLIVGIISSCSTDFDIAAPYREIMVVYGLLDPRDSAQYIRVSKAFLGEGNTLVMAQQSDSINYADILTVSLQRIRNNQLIESFTLTRVESIPKDSGTFAYPFQVYYSTNHQIYDDGSIYKLIVHNEQNNVEVISNTRIVGEIAVLHPTAAAADFATQLPTTMDFHPGANSKVFDMIIRFHYTETDSNGVTQQYYADWDFTDQVAGQEVSPFSVIAFKYFRPDFYKVLGGVIHDKPGVVRRVDNLSPSTLLPVEYRFIVGTEDVYTYYQLNQPSYGIVQDKPLFTTIENGAGLFSSRLIHSEFRNLSQNSKNAFDTSAYTMNLNFQF